MLVPTAYWPSLGYVKYLCESGEHQIFWSISEKYQKQTFRNRCIILTANGPLRLSVPVRKLKGNQSLTADIALDEQKKWKREHWRAIESAYRHSPYFEHYEKELELLFFDEYTSLVELNTALFQFFINHLELPFSLSTSERIETPTKIEFSETQSYANVFDYQGSFEELSILDALFNLGPLSRNLLVID